ncbi:zinc ribbon domain-containing protein [Alloscardovia sp. HMSC034E08]|uniref:zinc ribbon domain-containing protein n=1 Tax=Alloscardovia sp. HMSC034E08 TaxID=1739413 RepID=UPI001AEF8DFD|nr:zinc ribbon domain-containing protein [Alloscardovia sp. HMSC034E08]
MFCTKCGAQLVPNAKFCTKCGQPVQPVQPQPSTPSPTLAPATAPATTQPNPSQSNKKVIYTVIAVVAALAVAVGGFFVYKVFFAKNQASEQTVKTSGTEFSVQLDKKWTAKSTPVLLHIVSTDIENDVDMYRAVRPTDGKNTNGSATVELRAGEYDVEYVSPVNADGSIYETPEDLSLSIDKSGTATGNKTASDFKIVPAQDVDTSDIEDIISELKEAAKDKKSGVTKKDIKIAQTAMNGSESSSEDSDAKLSETVKKIESRGDTAFTGIVRIVKSADELAKYIGAAPGNANVLDAPYAILLLDKPTGYEHETDKGDGVLMKETASYIVLAASGGEPATNSSVDHWTKYKDMRVVLSGAKTALSYSANGNYYPYNPFATSALNLEYSAKVGSAKPKSVSLPSGSFTEIVDQDPKYSYSPSSFTLDGNTLALKHGYDGTTDTYSITTDEAGSTAARRTYTLSGSKAGYRINHMVYYPETGDILIGTTRYSVFRKG